MNFLETFWSVIIFCLFLSYLILLFQIVGDIFRDSTLSGGYKALWVFFLLVAPVITALVYIIVRGNGMTERNIRAVSNAQKEAEEYVRSVAGTPSPADQIAAAKSLLDAGTINDAEFQQLKAKALA
ncbi:SHOCT domain-containing protein [Arthrobacter sp. ERGS1:01]|uniref:SHOCT domain-containing protein n=1 Tax=Arthrobacter sp. ERGS1:01 TaxID=1704044 RepID=UPI000B252D18|nr:SHOCT domain-containing protein [Arthrobacter sp. ERGS1:01]